jgi:hypothetical protein
MENRALFDKYYKNIYYAKSIQQYQAWDYVPRKYVAMGNSKDAYEEVGLLGVFGEAAEKPEGNPFSYDERAQGPTKKWVHKAYGLACRITREAIDDLKLNMMDQTLPMLGRSLAYTKHKLSTALYLDMDIGAVHTNAWGDAICSNATKMIGGGTYDNLGVAADPTPAVMEAEIANFENAVDSRGKQVQRKAGRIVHGPALNYRFEEVLESKQSPYTANNAINVLSRLGLEHVSDPLIPLSDRSWAITTKEKDSKTGYIVMMRVKPQQMRSSDAETLDRMFYVYMRMSVECAESWYWRKIPSI